MGFINVIPKEIEQKLSALLTDLQAKLVVLDRADRVLAKVEREVDAYRALRERLLAAAPPPGGGE
jgi:hypothetical protein